MSDIEIILAPMKFPTMSSMVRSFAAVLILLNHFHATAGKYEHFKVSVYARAYEVQKMSDPGWLHDSWETISSQLDVDKIYLETHRDLLVVDDETLENAKLFFRSKGIEVAGGITYTIDESNLFQTYCYSNPEYLEKAKAVIEHTAKHFDEIILDDFFFTSCKCAFCIEAKGQRDWGTFRRDLMNRTAEDWILGPAKSVNPNVKVIIKYPNWYEHFQGLGFDLEQGPKLFDGIYTGTETRDSVLSNQHLQPYHGFLILRYFTQLSDGRNGGGWVDPFASFTLGRYAEQLWMTLLAKAPEITLFDYRMMLVSADAFRKPSQSETDCMWNDNDMRNFKVSETEVVIDEPTFARAAGYALSTIDPLLRDLGEPIAIPSYKPFQFLGDDFLQTYIGMLGIPIRLVSEFPENAEVTLLTASAAQDPEIVGKIEQQLRKGKEIVITSGLLELLQDRGLKGIAEVSMSNHKTLGKDFLIRRTLVEKQTPVLFSQLNYLTNDSWPVAEVMNEGVGKPILHFAPYGGGRLWIWVIPDHVGELYLLPEVVLNEVRKLMNRPLHFWLQGPAKVSIFPYDNRKMVIHSFNDETVKVQLVTSDSKMVFRNCDNHEPLEMKSINDSGNSGRRNEGSVFATELSIPPHSAKIVEW